MVPWRRPLLRLAWATAWTLDSAGRAVTYLAAGALTRDELRAAIGRSWESYGLDESFILSGFAAWERDCYDRFVRPADTILLIGCGTGRDLIAFLRRGHEVEGIEPSGRSVAVAQRMLDTLGLRAVLHRAGIETVELRRTFDVVVFSLFCYSYIPESRARLAVLDKVKTSLNPGGRIMVLYNAAARRRRLPIRLTRLVARLTRSDWTPEIGDKVWVSLSTGGHVHFDHEFEPDEIEAEAAAAGLRVLFHRRGPEIVDGLCVLTARE